MFIVHIQNKKTGEVRKHIEEGDWDYGKHYQWTYGNYGCDCNRALFFARAGGEDDTDVDQPCGNHVIFDAVVELPNGVRVYIDRGD